MHYLIKLIGILVVTSVLPLTSWAQDLNVDNAWVRMPPPVSDTAAVYMSLSTTGKEVIKIKSVKTEAAGHAMFHTMMMHGDMMHMSVMRNVEVTNEAPLVFEPNGNHLMLEGLTKPLKAGDVVVIQLTSDSGETYVVNAEVRDMRKAKQSQAQQHHSHH